MHMVEICLNGKPNGKCVEIGRDLFERALEIAKEMIKRGDLRTKWWIRFIGAVFFPVTVVGRASFSFIDTGGTSRTQHVKDNFGDLATIFGTKYCNNRFWISVGSGTTPPAVEDYRLASKIADSLASYTLDDINGIITLSSGFTFGSDTTINEVGLEWEACVYSYGTCGRILVDRTVLSSPFTAPANTPITITYKIVV